MNRLLEGIQGQPMFDILRKANELERQGRDIIHLEIGDSNFGMPESAREKVAKLIVDGSYQHYCASSGLPELLEVAQMVTERSRGFRPDINQLLPTVGANQQIYLALQAICNPGDAVLIPAIGFPTYLSAVKLLGLVPTYYDITDDNVPDLNHVADLMQCGVKAIIINSPSNPMGSIISGYDMRIIYDLCQQNGVYLISDEVYSRLTYTDGWNSPSRFDQCKERTIVINSMSKSFAMTGWRIGTMMAPADVIKACTTILQTQISCVMPLAQMASAIALMGEESQQTSFDVVAEYRRRRDVLVGGLNKTGQFICRYPSGAFYVWAKMLDDIYTAEYLLDKLGIACCPGSVFGDDTEHVRFSYANCGVDRLQEAVRRIGGDC